MFIIIITEYLGLVQVIIFSITYLSLKSFHFHAQDNTFYYEWKINVDIRNTYFHNLFFTCYVVYCHFNLKVNMFNQYQSLGFIIEMECGIEQCSTLYVPWFCKIVNVLFFPSNLSRKS